MTGAYTEYVTKERVKATKYFAMYNARISSKSVRAKF